MRGTGNVEQNCGGEFKFYGQRGPGAPKNPLDKEEVLYQANITPGRNLNLKKFQPREQKPEDDKSDGNMKNGETITLTFGRFNPPTELDTRNSFRVLKGVVTQVVVN